MRHTVTSPLLFILLVILLTNISSALNFSISFPKEVEAENAFKVLISSDEQDDAQYDVKIFINKHTKEFSEILVNEKWQSPFSYLENAYPQQTEFSILPHFIGDSNLCTRLRNSQERSKGFSEICEPITISSSSTGSEDSSSSTPSNPASKQTKSAKNVSISNQDNPTPPSTKKVVVIPSSPEEESIPEPTKQMNIQALSTESDASEKIVLTSKKVSSNKTPMLITKKENLRTYLVYGFASFCVLIIIFLSLRRI